MADVATTPGFWVNETSGVLAPAILAYLNGAPMTSGEIAAMRAYLRQWIGAPCWRGTFISELRESVDSLDTRRKISDWLDAALDAGIDPL